MLQTVVLSRVRIGNVTLCVVPVCIVCVAVREGAERSALYGLLTGLAFCLSGASLGALYIVTLTLTGALAGAICDRFYTRTFMPAMLLSLGGLALCEGAAFLFRIYLRQISAAFWQTVLLPEILFSVLAFPLFYLGAWAISKIGR